MKISDKRFKLALFGVLLFFVEAIVKTIFIKFPIVEVLSAQVGLAGYYITTQTINDIKEVKYANSSKSI